MLHCKFSGDYNHERIFKIGQYLAKLCVEHLGLTFLAHPVCVRVWCMLWFQIFSLVRDQENPQQFHVEFVKGAIRTYTSTDRL